MAQAGTLMPSAFAVAAGDVPPARIWANVAIPITERDDLRKKYRQLLGSPGRFGGTIVTIDSSRWDSA